MYVKVKIHFQILLSSFKVWTFYSLVCFSIRWQATSCFGWYQHGTMLAPTCWYQLFQLGWYQHATMLVPTQCWYQHNVGTNTMLVPAYVITNVGINVCKLKKLVPTYWYQHCSMLVPTCSTYIRAGFFSSSFKQWEDISSTMVIFIYNCNSSQGLELI